MANQTPIMQMNMREAAGRMSSGSTFRDGMVKPVIQTLQRVGDNYRFWNVFTGEPATSIWDVVEKVSQNDRLLSIYQRV